MKIESNFNNEVTVKLTKHGENILKDYYKYSEVSIDENGYYTNQLHMIIHIFGNHMQGFSHLPFSMVFEMDAEDDNSIANRVLENRNNQLKALVDDLEDELSEIKQVVVNMTKQIYG